MPKGIGVEDEMGTAKLKFSGGLHINDAAQDLIDAVASGAEAAEGEFNGVTLRAAPGSTVSQIVSAWNVESEAQAETYRSSPEGKAAKAASAARLEASQAEADKLMGELRTLDFTSDVAVLDWLRRFVEPSDHIGVEANKFFVIQAFMTRGFTAGANTGDDYRADDRDNSYRYLVGQALSCLQSIGAIHGVFYRFHDEWKAKFLAA